MTTTKTAAPTPPAIPPDCSAVELTPMELNGFRLAGQHTRLTPEVLAAVAAGKSSATDVVEPY